MLHVTKRIKHKNPSTNPESLHEAQVEPGALLKVHLHKMCQPDKQQLSKIWQMSPINNEVIASPSFNSQCLLPKLEMFKERWGTQESKGEELLLLLCLVSMPKKEHNKETFVHLPRVPECLVHCWEQNNEVATFPNGQIDVATHKHSTSLSIHTAYRRDSKIFSFSWLKAGISA